MIDAKELGKLIAEDVVNDRGICIYPGGFKPPHKGHFEAVKNLTARSYVIEVVILISAKSIDGITPEDSMKVWTMYLKAAPNPKVKLRLATEESPIQDIFKYVSTKPDLKTLYIAGGKEESDDQSYMESLRKVFQGTVKSIAVQEHLGGLTDESVRNKLKMRDYEAFKDAVPEAAYNKGFADEIYQLLIKDMPENKPTNDTERA
jgi:hypothetical protein